MSFETFLFYIAKVYRFSLKVVKIYAIFFSVECPVIGCGNVFSDTYFVRISTNSHYGFPLFFVIGFKNTPLGYRQRCLFSCLEGLPPDAVSFKCEHKQQKLKQKILSSSARDSHPSEHLTGR